MLFALQLLVSLAALRSVVSFTSLSDTLQTRTPLQHRATSSQQKLRRLLVVVKALDVGDSNASSRDTGTNSDEESSIAIPCLLCPPVLSECSYLAGNVGFDPLRLAKSQDDLLMYREMEIKHGRLAMLAAAGWPVSEIMDRPLADELGMPVLLTEGGRAPSLLNGGMEAVSPVWWGMCLGLTAAIDLYGVEKSRSGDPTYFPGNLGFDPLGFYPTDTGRRKRMELAEIKHGRTAMMAVVGYAAQEYVTELGVVEEAPFFFPILS